MANGAWTASTASAKRTGPPATAIQASEGGKSPASLVTRKTYADFVLRAELWVSEDADSGVFFRCQEPARITGENCDEANVFDRRPGPTYATGAIVKVAPLTAPMLKAGGRWNTLEVSARGTRLTVSLNGVRTAEIDDAKLASGRVALQWGRGVVGFRKVENRPLSRTEPGCRRGRPSAGRCLPDGLLPPRHPLGRPVAGQRRQEASLGPPQPR